MDAFAVKNKTNGFTLAEVLITLGIIGVVAAMTMPSLTAKWQEKTIEAQFKRSYSNLYNAMRMIVARDGILPQCYYPQDGIHWRQSNWAQCEEFYNKLSAELKVIKTCNGNAYSDGCIPKYEGVDTLKEYENQGIISGCNGFSQSIILNKSFAMVMNDGSILFTYNGPSNNWDYSGVFAIDLNGKKGPNKWGYDLFSFAWVEENHFVRMSVGNCQLIEKGGRDPEELLLSVK